MAQSSTAQLFGLGRNDPLFARVRIEAQIVWDLSEDTNNEAEWLAAREHAQHALRALLEQTYKAQYVEHKRGERDG